MLGGGWISRRVNKEGMNEKKTDGVDDWTEQGRRAEKRLNVRARSRVTNIKTGFQGESKRKRDKKRE